jgi:pre-mRNA-splicing factor ATP-dependent RNA helicase DHX16
MTWIKPSFLWMAYRSGYATKQNQEHVLAIEISRQGFEWALSHAVLSHIPALASAEQTKSWKKAVEESCVRVQWDPERDLYGNPLDYRSLQVGLRGEAVERFVDEWIVSIKDVTGVMHDIKEKVEAGNLEGAKKLLPVEEVYTLPEGIARGIGMVTD